MIDNSFEALEEIKSAARELAKASDDGDNRLFNHGLLRLKNVEMFIDSLTEVEMFIDSLTEKEV